MTYQEQEMGRAEYLLPMEPLHEVVQDELAEDPSVLVRLDESLESDRLPRCYHENPVVAEARRNGEEPPNPIGIYMDGLPYSLTDSVLGVWAIMLMTGARRLVAVVRKKLVCQCGCRGWCTYWSLLWCLRWSCDALAAGFFPDHRHDRMPWRASDFARRERAGQRMRRKCVVIQFRGDWPELCERHGFPTWQSGIRPCFCCNGCGGILYDGTQVGLDVVPWHVNTDEDFEIATARCEIWTTISRDDHLHLVGIIAYDKRKDGAQGLALTRNYPALNLLQDDRLDPFPDFLDVGRFFLN